MIVPPFSAFAWGSEPRHDLATDGRDDGESWTERAMRGPSSDNPSQSLKKRLKRAAFFEKRDREVAAGDAVPVKLRGWPAGQSRDRPERPGNRLTASGSRPETLRITETLVATVRPSLRTLVVLLRRAAVAERGQPLLDREIVLHPEAEPVTAADLVDRDRPDRVGHGREIVARRRLAHLPAAIVRRLAVFILDVLDQVQAAVALDPAAAKRAGAVRLVEDHLGGAEIFGAAVEEAKRVGQRGRRG